jgi:hypothetical protein
MDQLIMEWTPGEEGNENFHEKRGWKVYEQP